MRPIRVEPDVGESTARNREEGGFWDLVHLLARALLVSIVCVEILNWGTTFGAAARFEQVFGRPPVPLADHDLIEQDELLGALTAAWNMSVQILMYTWFLLPGLPLFIGGRIRYRALIFLICSIATFALWSYWTEPSSRTLLWLLD